MWFNGKINLRYPVKSIYGILTSEIYNLGVIMKTTLNVILLEHTPNPERTIAAAAKLCYSESGASELSEEMSEQEVIRFLEILLKMGHLSPVEHASFSFAIEGVSRALTHQLVRHRLASFSQKSQRYVSETDFEYIVPPSIESNEEALRLYEEMMASIQASYSQIRDLIYVDFNEKLVQEGVSEASARSQAEKMANEDARFVLANATETKIVVTMNARELLHFFGQRCCERAQWEIRELATQMLVLVKKVAPTVFKNGGPPCLNGNCPEGSMSCMKAPLIREKFANL
jgi:thymidylate synthase (FAD)